MASRGHYVVYHQVSAAVRTTQRCSASINDAVIDHLAADDAKVPVLAWMQFAMHLEGSRLTAGSCDSMYKYFQSSPLHMHDGSHLHHSLGN